MAADEIKVESLARSHGVVGARMTRGARMSRRRCMVVSSRVSSLFSRSLKFVLNGFYRPVSRFFFFFDFYVSGDGMLSPLLLAVAWNGGLFPERRLSVNHCSIDAGTRKLLIETQQVTGMLASLLLNQQQMREVRRCWAVSKCDV